MKGVNKIWRLLPSSPKVSVGKLFLLKKENDRFPTTTFGNDDKQKSKKQKQMSSPRVLAARRVRGSVVCLCRLLIGR